MFVSSTYEDLVEERKMVSTALLESGCFPAGMELFPASNKKSWDIIKNVIDESDYYLIIIAGRYGSSGIDDDGKKVGYTEMEFDYALRTQKPIIAFIHNNIEELPFKKVERSKAGLKRLEEFRNKVMNGRQVNFWSNKDELVSKIKTSISSETKETLATGWSRNYVEGNENWGLVKVFESRAEKNKESDPILEKHNIKQLDGIAFGLTSFRSKRENDLLKCLKNGMQMRLLVMDPDGELISRREREENSIDGSMKYAINQLVEWGDKLNKQSGSGKIRIKAYRCMTLDFYWRMDDVLYVGPYLYGIVSQQTLTYKYKNGGKGFTFYTDYFEQLWENEDLCYELL